MIRYTLVCEAGHDFEAWFRSSESYDSQADSGQIACPICGATTVTKAIMSPALGKAGFRSPNAVRHVPGETVDSVPAAQTSEMTIASGGPERQARAFLRAVREHVTKIADDVGQRFPEEARRMHYGETESRPIYGRASVSEARALIEEGIGVAPLPAMPDELN